MTLHLCFLSSSKPFRKAFRYNLGDLFQSNPWWRGQECRRDKAGQGVTAAAGNEAWGSAH